MMGIEFGIVAMLCWGLADFIAAKAVRDKGIGELNTLFWSQAIGFLLMIIPAMIYPFPNQQAFTPENMLILAICGALWALSYIGFYSGVKHGKVAIISPIFASSAIITAILAIILFNEILQPMAAMGVALVIAGTILSSFRLRDLLLVKLSSAEKGLAPTLAGTIAVGIFYILLAVITTPFGLMFAMMAVKLFTTLFLLVYSRASRTRITVPSSGQLMIGAIGLLDVLALMGFMLGAQSGNISEVAPIAGAFPAVTIVLALLFLKEKLELNQMIGIIAILLGLWMLAG